jgi:2-polyprenyl-3-methyl-5-hydroxy-6-metoxy-1,4-benzoquinol methylase
MPKAYDTQSLKQYQHLKPSSDDVLRFKIISKYCVGDVLDAGCGSGLLKNHLNKDRINSYTGLDVDGKIDIHGSVYDLPFKNESFDTVTILEVLEHLEHPIAALREVVRVSRRRVVISVPNPWNMNQIVSLITRNHNIMEPNHINLFGDNEIGRLCERVGLKIVKKERFYILMPILRKLIPIKSKFGQWNIYVCEKWCK